MLLPQMRNLTAALSEIALGSSSAGGDRLLAALIYAKELGAAMVKRVITEIKRDAFGNSNVHGGLAENICCCDYGL